VIIEKHESVYNGQINIHMRFGDCRKKDWNGVCPQYNNRYLIFTYKHQGPTTRVTVSVTHSIQIYWNL